MASCPGPKAAKHPHTITLHLLYAKHNVTHVFQKVPILTHPSIEHYPKRLGDHPGAFLS
uniref:Uncharacterized protein n=1 Tax=Anguilla anguilla TaxID=7936 RepID=A0A0E9QQW9_ANGAN